MVISLLSFSQLIKCLYKTIDHQNCCWIREEINSCLDCFFSSTLFSQSRFVVIWLNPPYSSIRGCVQEGVDCKLKAIILATSWQLSTEWQYALLLGKKPRRYSTIYFFLAFSSFYVLTELWNTVVLVGTHFVHQYCKKCSALLSLKSVNSHFPSSHSPGVTLWHKLLLY